MMNNVLGDFGYTGIGDIKSNRKTCFTIILPKLIGDNQKTKHSMELIY